jgi:hypothetical protein
VGADHELSSWIQKDGNSVRHHEGGKRHKDAVENKIKAKRSKQFEDDKQQRDVAQQMREIEKAAAAQVSIRVNAALGAP